MILQLKPLSKKIRGQYADKLIDGLCKNIINGRKRDKKTAALSDAAKEVLLPGFNTSKPDKSILRRLLVSEPRPLARLNKKLTKKLEALPNGERPSKPLLAYIFNYEGVFHNKELSFWLAKLVERNTCVYCNRQYVFTIEAQDIHPASVSETKRLARPVFDHWFPKSEYPLLSLSLHNLIPSCTICNSSIKGETALSLNKHIHPYVREPQEVDFTFRADLASGGKSKWKLKLVRKPGSKIDNTIKAFCLDEIYDLHSDLEAKDIMDFHDAYPDDYISSCLANIASKSKKHLTAEDVYRMLYGTECDDDKMLDRPLSKLKKDLLKQIGIIK